MKSLVRGVPQGSILGLILSTYMNELTETIVDTENCQPQRETN